MTNNLNVFGSTKTKGHKQDNQNGLRSYEHTLYIPCQLIQNLTNVKMQNINGLVKQLIILEKKTHILYYICKYPSGSPLYVGGVCVTHLFNVLSCIFSLRSCLVPNIAYVSGLSIYGCFFFIKHFVLSTSVVCILGRL
jgi:hypothetical protein